MTHDREERYAAIYSHDTVYRPPQEEDCAMLEVALGCSWGRCKFCDFARDPFHIHSMEKIQRNIEELSRLATDKDRIFFLGENALCLDTEKLLTIMALCKEKMPKVTSFAMYARFDDVLRKGPKDLARLRQAGLEDLHIGLESGSDSVLALMNKGVTTFEMLEAARLLEQADIGYFVTVILGLGGKAYRNLHAIETGRLLSRMKPRGIWCLNLKVWPNTPLEAMAKRGDFEPMNPWETLLEERLLLQNINLSAPCFYMDTTALNLVTLEGILPQAKDSILASIERLLGWEEMQQRYGHQQPH